MVVSCEMRNKRQRREMSEKCKLQIVKGKKGRVASLLLEEPQIIYGKLVGEDFELRT